MIEDRRVYGAGYFTSIKSYFHPCEIYRNCRIAGAYSEESKYGKKAIFWN